MPLPALSTALPVALLNPLNHNASAELVASRFCLGNPGAASATRDRETPDAGEAVEKPRSIPGASLADAEGGTFCDNSAEDIPGSVTADASAACVAPTSN
jgi:hypothetical protein